ncbi:MAG: hypothetical protein DME16_18775 [Candidatus Rokuibacteriota bacterium]|nr:MAG: hypothetical protein DME16_18775 [Candidatus Rokubacteria bacterium]
MVDDIVLKFQRMVDRVARWARLGVPADPGRRRFLIIQIDGLSEAVLDKALHGRRLRHIRRLLRTGRLARKPMSVGIPSTTPTFHAAAMYGIQPDIPGFHYYDKRERREVHFPMPGAADFVESRQMADRHGILAGGACYGCVFTGGAPDSLLTFARLLKPTRAGLPLLRLLLSAALLGWVVVKALGLTAFELARFVVRTARSPRAARSESFRWLGLKIVFSVWIRELFTLAVSADLYRGARAVYVNYLDYDVFAHAFGPAHRSAMRALYHIDSSIGQLARVIERLPEYHYDLYILSDHGQTPTRNFRQVSGGESLESVVRAALGGAATGGPWSPPRQKKALGLTRHLARYRRTDCRGLLQRFFNHTERDRPAWAREDGPPTESIRVITAGPNAFVYFLDSPEPLTIEAVEPADVGEHLSRHPGIGLVLARSAHGPVCWWRGRPLSLDGNGDGGPFAGRADRGLVLKGLRDLMAMPSAGDLVLYGIGAPHSNVSFIDERGAHAGPSETEMQTFMLHPATVTLPTPLTHPVQLYPHFAAYEDDAESLRGVEGSGRRDRGIRGARTVDG